MIAEPTLKKMRNRLLAINLVSLALVVAVAFSIIYISFYNRAQNEIDRQIASIPRDVMENLLLTHQDTRSLVTFTSPEGDRTITISGDPRVPIDYSKSFVVNIDNDGNIMFFTILDMSDQTIVDAVESAIESAVVSSATSGSGTVEIEGRTWKFSIEPNLSSVSTYRYSIVYLDIEDTNRSLGALAASFLIIGAIAIIAILLISLQVANRAIRPVEEGMARQKRFIADASHELKTPIAVIAANAEAAAGAAMTAGISNRDLSYWVGNISHETNRMGDLIENLLALAKAEEKPAELVAFDIAHAVHEEANRVEAFLFEKNIAFEIDLKAAEENITVVSDRTKVQAILSVRLENAVKYTPEKGHVRIAMGRENGKGVFVSVSNTGDFIPQEEIAQVFDRFFRSDPSRNSETGGHGIGLSIAYEMAVKLGGMLYAESNQKEDGSAVNIFTLRLT